jgi:signal transduction histidine kinase
MSELYLILNCGNFFIRPSQCTDGENSVVSANDRVNASLKELLFIVVLFKIPVTELVYGWCITIESVSSRPLFALQHVMQGLFHTSVTDMIKGP